MPELDGLRGVAILSIIVYHYFVQPLEVVPGSFVAYGQKYFSILWLGVDIFFVLSGFLLGGILLDQRNATNLFRVFYARRFLRIVPPYLLLLIALLVVTAWVNHTQPIGTDWLMGKPFPPWAFVLYIQNFFMAAAGQFGGNFAAITWSLAIEEQFYLLFPLFIYFCPPSKLVRVLLIAVVSAPLIRLGLLFGLPRGEVASCVLLPARWDSLAAGALAAWCQRDPNASALVYRHQQPLFCGLALMWVAIALFPFVGFGQLSFSTIAIGYSWIAIASALLILLLHTRSLQLIASLLRNRILRLFGRVSYMLYLVHSAVLGLMFLLLFRRGPAIASPLDLGVVCGALIVSICLAASTWYLFEKRLIQLGHRFAYRNSTVLKLAPQ